MHVLRAARIGVGIGALLLAAAAPVAAEPSTDPCGLAVSLFCRFVPLAPELTGDVDLTLDQPPADPAAPPVDSGPIADICANGCI